MAPAPAQGAVRRAAQTTEEERRRNRMNSNRLSAQKSRMKQRQHVEDLTAHVERLQRENEAMRASVGGVLQRCRTLEQENRVLAAHARELCAALMLRNSQLRLLGGVTGVPLDVPGVPNHLVQLYGGAMQMPVMPLQAEPLPLPVEIQMLLEPDVMEAVSMLGF